VRGRVRACVVNRPEPVSQAMASSKNDGIWAAPRPVDWSPKVYSVLNTIVGILSHIAIKSDDLR
jgi:hypothetical protein